MDAKQLARLVLAMRAAQAQYFRGCKGPDRMRLLMESKDAERKVDAACDAILFPPRQEQKGLFGDHPRVMGPS